MQYYVMANTGLQKYAYLLLNFLTLLNAWILLFVVYLLAFLEIKSLF